MFAVIKTGGKQYRVTPGDVLTVEKLAGANGDTIEFTDVLMVSDGTSTQIGSPLVSGAVVKTRIINQERGDKVIVFKKKRRHNYRRKNGHRQFLTAVQILEIAAKGISGKAEKLVEPKAISSIELAKALNAPKGAATATLAKAPAAAKKAAKVAAPKAEKAAVAKPSAAKAAAEKPEAKTAKAPAKAKKPAAAKDK